MRKNSFIIVCLVVVMISLSFAPAFAKTRDDKSEFMRTQALMGENKDGEEPAPAPPSEGQPPAESPSAPTIPAPDAGEPAPVPENIKLFYCVIPKDKAVNLEAYCNKYGAPILVYRSFNQLVVRKMVGVVVTVNPKDKYFISQLRKNFNAKPLKDVSLRVKINALSVLKGVNITKEDFVAGDFGGCDEILGKMIKTPYGARCTMFKTIAKSFPGLLDKVTVKDKEFLGLGKKHKYLYNPSVTIEMLALNMNGKGKNVTLYFNQFLYDTIKHEANYNWNK